MMMGYIFLHLSGEGKGDFLCQYRLTFECFTPNFAAGLRPNTGHMLNKLIGIGCSKTDFCMTCPLLKCAGFYIFWSRFWWQFIDFIDHGRSHVFLPTESLPSSPVSGQSSSSCNSCELQSPRSYL